jgi:hypothetical protein
MTSAVIKMKLKEGSGRTHTVLDSHTVGWTCAHVLGGKDTAMEVSDASETKPLEIGVEW